MAWLFFTMILGVALLTLFVALAGRPAEHHRDSATRPGARGHA